MAHKKISLCWSLNHVRYSYMKNCREITSEKIESRKYKDSNKPGMWVMKGHWMRSKLELRSDEESTHRVCRCLGGNFEFYSSCNGLPLIYVGESDFTLKELQLLYRDQRVENQSHLVVWFCCFCLFILLCFVFKLKLKVDRQAISWQCSVLSCEEFEVLSLSNPKRKTSLWRLVFPDCFLWRLVWGPKNVLPERKRKCVHSPVMFPMMLYYFGACEWVGW